MGATNKKAEGVPAPTANILHLCGCNCARRLDRMQAPGTKTVEQYIGTALRHCREGLCIALQNGPGARAGRELERAREALDSALWLYSYCEADK